MFELQFEEQYALITIITPQITPELLQDLETTVIENCDEGNGNFILNLEELQDNSIDLTTSLTLINKTIADTGGLLVVASAPSELRLKLEQVQIITVPTLEEAIDYVFMEEIEKNFWDDDEGEESKDKEA